MPIPYRTSDKEKAKGAKFRYPSKRANLITVAIRLGMLLLMFLSIAMIVYLHDAISEEDQYVDAQTNINTDLTYIDALYFTVISITTTGYGDITPVTQEARLMDTIILSIGRVIMWVIIVGTAYQFIFERYREVLRMKNIQQGLSDHVIICGFDTTGKTAAQELVAKGMKKSKIVIIEADAEDSQLAAEQGYVSIQGDPSKEDILTSAMIQKATSMIITLSRDDTNVLITLTAKDLNPNIKVIAQVIDLENEKLLKKGGVDVIIAPFVAGGNLMATATSQPHVVDLLEDVMTARSGVYLNEREVKADEVGKTPKSIPGRVVMGVVRDGKIVELDKLDKLKLQKGDHLLFLKKK